MSSLRNAVKRVTHKERSQPQSRSHLGLLEKKKDYRLRSRDYHNKQDRLRLMREKAANRNPDEFYFGMHRSRQDERGRHVKTDEARRIELEQKGLGPDAVKIMKDQDLSYVRMQRMMDGKKVERLQASLHHLESEGAGSVAGKKRKHTVFVDGGHEAVERFDVAAHFDTLPELVGRTFNRPRLRDLKKQAESAMGLPSNIDLDDDYYDDHDVATQQRKPLSEAQLIKKAKQQRKLERRIARQRSSAYTEVRLRTERLAKLQNAEDHLIVQKQAGMKGRKRKIQGAEDGKPAVYKWRRIRAR